MTKRCLITGVTGQDGSYLAELLLSKGYEVTGLVRRSSVSNLERIENILTNSNLTLVEGEVSDAMSVYSIIEQGNFDEVYNLAAQSHVGTSFKQPDYTFQVDAMGPMYLLEAIRKYSPSTRFYQASTSELFGCNVTCKYTQEKAEEYQDEKTAFMPQSPYAAAKLAAHNMVRIYRDGYNLHASAGILFNHEGPRRGEQFVTRKITKWIADFYHWKSNHKVDPNLGGQEVFKIPDLGVLVDSIDTFPKLRLGNLDAYRDWGHARDYVEAMWLMLQQDYPDDYVIATGKTYSVRNFLEEAFNEIGISDFTPYVVIDPKFYRPAEVEYLCGRPRKAIEKLGWQPKISFKELVKEMVWSDINGKETTQEKIVY